MGRGNNAEAAELQDLVVGALTPEETKAKPETSEQATFAERMKNRQTIDRPSLVALGRKIEKQLFLANPEKDQLKIRDDFADWCLAIAMNGRYVRAKVGWEPSKITSAGMSIDSLMMYSLHDFLRQPTKENLTKLYYMTRGYTNAVECQIIQQTTASCLDYLEERWGEDTAQRLHEVTGTAKNTTKKWLGGSNPSSENQRNIQTVVEAIYALENDCWMSPKEADLWMHTPSPELGGITPWEQLGSKGGWSLNAEFDKVLRKTFEDANQP